MSEYGDDDLPQYLVDALLSRGPSDDAVELVKNAFTWRTIDAELMELAYDSVLDDAGVRDANAARTIEFTVGDISVVIEIAAGVLRGTVATGDAATGDPAATDGVRLIVEGNDPVERAVVAGAFRFDNPPAGTARLELTVANRVMTTPAFAIR